MGRPHPIELRERVVLYVDEGHSHQETARVFTVSVSFVNNMIKLRRETGSLAARKQGNPGKGKLSPYDNWVKERLGEKGDLFITQWLLDTDMQRRAQVGLNKGEAHHALKNALRIGRQGEIRDRTSESQHYRMAGLNLLAAIIIYWNTKHLGKALEQRQKSGLLIPENLLPHVSPLGWAHILLTGEYRWPKNA